VRLEKSTSHMIQTQRRKSSIKRKKLISIWESTNSAALPSKGPKVIPSIIVYAVAMQESVCSFELMKQRNEEHVAFARLSRPRTVFLIYNENSCLEMGRADCRAGSLRLWEGAHPRRHMEHAWEAAASRSGGEVTEE